MFPYMWPLHAERHWWVLSALVLVLAGCRIAPHVGYTGCMRRHAQLAAATTAQTAEQQVGATQEHTAAACIGSPMHRR